MLISIFYLINCQIPEYVQYRKYEEFKNPIKIDPTIGKLKVAYEISIIKIQKIWL